RRGAARERRLVRPGHRTGAAVHPGGAHRGAVGAAGDGDRAVDRAAARARLGAAAPHGDQDGLTLLDAPPGGTLDPQSSSTRRAGNPPVATGDHRVGVIRSSDLPWATIA